MTKRTTYSAHTTRSLVTAAVVWMFIAVMAISGWTSHARANTVGFWNFNNGSAKNTLNDTTLTLQAGTISGGTLNSGYATGSVANLPTGAPNYTMSAMVNTTTIGNMGIVGWGNYGTVQQCVAIRTINESGVGDGNSFRHYWWGNDLDSLNNTAWGTSVLSGRWNHVVATGTSNHQYTYMNGQLLNDRTTTSGTTHNLQATNFAVGATGNANWCERWDGSLDNIGVFNSTLSHTDIINMSSARYNGMISEWNAQDYTSGASWVDRVGGVAAKAISGVGTPTRSGNYVDFNGSSALEIAAADNPVAGLTSFTVLAAFTPDTAGNDHEQWYGCSGIFSGEQSGIVNDWGLCYGGTNVVAGYGYQAGAADTTLRSTGTVAAGTNAVAGYQLDGTSMGVYINGTSQGTTTVTQAGRGQYTLYIGRNGTANAYYLDGKISSIRIFNRVLNSSEMAYYSGQMLASHSYTEMTSGNAGSITTSAGSTLWAKTGTMDISGRSLTAPLGIYVGGFETAGILTASHAQFSGAKMTLVLGGGTLKVSNTSDTYANTLNIDGGKVNITGNLNFVSDSRMVLKEGSYTASGDTSFGGSSEYVQTAGTTFTSGSVNYSSTRALTLNAGTFTTTGDFNINGEGNNTATVTLASGSTIHANKITIGDTGKAVLNYSGATVSDGSANPYITEGFEIGQYGTFNMYSHPYWTTIVNNGTLNLYNGGGTWINNLQGTNAGAVTQRMDAADMSIWYDYDTTYAGVVKTSQTFILNSGSKTATFTNQSAIANVGSVELKGNTTMVMNTGASSTYGGQIKLTSGTFQVSGTNTVMTLTNTLAGAFKATDGGRLVTTQRFLNGTGNPPSNFYLTLDGGTYENAFSTSEAIEGCRTAMMGNDSSSITIGSGGGTIVLNEHYNNASYVTTALNFNGSLTLNGDLTIDSQGRTQEFRLFNNKYSSSGSNHSITLQNGTMLWLGKTIGNSSNTIYIDNGGLQFAWVRYAYYTDSYNHHLGGSEVFTSTEANNTVANNIVIRSGGATFMSNGDQSLYLSGNITEDANSTGGGITISGDQSKNVQINGTINISGGIQVGVNSGLYKNVNFTSTSTNAITAGGLSGYGETHTTFASGKTLTLTGAGNYSYDGVFTASNLALTHSGSGSQTFGNGSNDISFTTLANSAGTLTLTRSGGDGFSVTNQLAVSGGTLNLSSKHLNLNSSNSTISGGTLTGVYDFNIGNVYVGGPASSTVNMTGGTVNTANINVARYGTSGTTYSATFNQSGGTLNVTAYFCLADGDYSNSTFNLTGSGVIQSNGATGKAIIGNKGTAVYTQNGADTTATFSQWLSIGGDYMAAKQGTGTLNLQAGTLTTPAVNWGAGYGYINQTGGTFNATTLNLGAASNLVSGKSYLFDLNGADALLKTDAITNAGTLLHLAAGTLETRNVAGSLTGSGADLVFLGGNGTVTGAVSGGITLNGGSATFSGDTTIGDAFVSDTSSTVTVNSAVSVIADAVVTLNNLAGTNSSAVFTKQANSSNAMTLNNTSATSYAGSISAVGNAVNKTGAGNLTIGGALTSGNFTMSGAGNLAVNDGMTAGAVQMNSGSGNLSVDGILNASGAVDMNGGNLSVTSNLIADSVQMSSSSGTLTVGGNLNSTGLVDMGGGDVNVTGAMTAGSVLMNAGAGDLTVGGALNSTGAVTMNGGDLDVTRGLTASAFNVNSGNATVGGALTVGDLRLASGDLTANAGSTITGSLYVGSTNTLTATLNSCTMAGPVTGSGTIVLNTNGTVTMNGEGSTFSGILNVQSGTLNVNTDLDTTVATVGVADGTSATLRIGNGGQVGNTTVEKGTVQLASGGTIDGDITINDSSTNNQVAGTVTGGITLTKSGAQILMSNGTIGSDVVTARGTTFHVTTGTINGDIQIGQMPSEDVDPLEVEPQVASSDSFLKQQTTGSVVLPRLGTVLSLGTMDVDDGDAAVLDLTGADGVVVNGDVTLAPDSIMRLTLDVGQSLTPTVINGTTTWGQNTLDVVLNGKLVTDETYLLFETSELQGTTDDITKVTFRNSGGGVFFETSNVGDYITIENNGGMVQVKVSIDSASIPEPGTWVLLSLGLLGLAWMRRSRKRG